MKNNRDYLKKMKTTNIKIVLDHVYCLSTNIDTKLLEKVCWEKHDFLEEVLFEPWKFGGRSGLLSAAGARRILRPG